MDGRGNRISAKEVIFLFVATAVVVPVANSSGVSYKYEAHLSPLCSATIRNTWWHIPPNLLSFFTLKIFKFRSTYKKEGLMIEYPALYMLIMVSVSLESSI
jgi:hypothetical protein